MPYSTTVDRCFQVRIKSKVEAPDPRGEWRRPMTGQRSREPDFQSESSHQMNYYWDRCRCQTAIPLFKEKWPPLSRYGWWAQCRVWSGVNQLCILDTKGRGSFRLCIVFRFKIAEMSKNKPRPHLVIVHPHPGYSQWVFGHRVFRRSVGTSLPEDVPDSGARVDLQGTSTLPYLGWRRIKTDTHLLLVIWQATYQTIFLTNTCYCPDSDFSTFCYSKG